jgi:hypothetical protein
LRDARQFILLLLSQWESSRNTHYYKTHSVGNDYFTTGH